MTKRAAHVHRLDSAEEIRTSGMAGITATALLLALDLGWNATEMRNGMVQIRRGAVTVNLPSNQRSIKEGVSHAWIKKILRYGDPMKRLYLTSIVDDFSDPDPAVRARAIRQMEGLHVFSGDGTPETIARYFSEKSAAVADEPELVVVPDEPVVVEPPPEQPPAKGDPVVTKIKPWIARHSLRKEGGEVYESRAVLERKWSDGTLDYICPYEGCGFTNVAPRPVSAHYGGKHSKERPASQVVSERFLDPGMAWTPSERQAGRIHRLSREIDQAYTGLGEDKATPDNIAEWIVKHRDAERDLTDDTTPLTGDQIVERIRRLVDGGAYADLMARIEQMEIGATAKIEEARHQLSSKEVGYTNTIRAMEAQLTEKDQAVEAAQHETEVAQQRESEARERWQALREMINES